MSEPASGDGREQDWRYVFFGFVTPSTVFVSTPALAIGAKSDPASLKGRFIMAIKASHVVATFESSTEYSDHQTLRNKIEEFCTITTNCIALIKSTPITINLVSMHDVRANRSYFYVPAFLGMAESSEHGELTVPPESLVEMVNVAWASEPFQNALESFKDAMSHPAQTGFHCRRAYEALAHHFGHMSQRRVRSIAFQDMRKSLGITKDTEDGIAEAGGLVRHGASPWISGDQRLALLKIMQEILRRFAAIHPLREEAQLNLPFAFPEI